MYLRTTLSAVYVLWLRGRRSRSPIVVGQAVPNRVRTPTGGAQLVASGRNMEKGLGFPFVDSAGGDP